MRLHGRNGGAVADMSIHDRLSIGTMEVFMRIVRRSLRGFLAYGEVGALGAAGDR